MLIIFLMPGSNMHFLFSMLIKYIVLMRHATRSLLGATRCACAGTGRRCDTNASNAMVMSPWTRIKKDNQSCQSGGQSNQHMSSLQPCNLSHLSFASWQAAGKHVLPIVRPDAAEARGCGWIMEIYVQKCARPWKLGMEPLATPCNI